MKNIMGRKTKLQLEAEKLTRSHGFKKLIKLLNSNDMEAVDLAIGIIEAKGYKLLATELRECVSGEECRFNTPHFHIFTGFIMICLINC